jgi:hypothetical protein
MNHMFWLENFRVGLVIALIYLINMNMQMKNAKHIEKHFRKLEKETIILHHRLEKLIKGELE